MIPLRAATPSSDPQPSDLAAFFAPRSIAVVGASADRARSGGRVLATLESTGYAGAIHCVSPSQDRIGQRPCHASLAEAPGDIDLALICVSAERTPAAIRECGVRGVRAALVFADGFSDPALGAELHAAIAEAKAACGLRVMGPNTVGSRDVNGRVFATIATDINLPQLPGNVAAIGQSGGLTLYFGSAKLRGRGVGAKYVIDTGAEFDVDAAECLEWAADDPEVACAALILEGCRDGRRLMAAVERTVAMGKPVVFWKTGRSAASAAQIASHTGSLAGNAAIFEAALEAAGAIVVRDETQFVDAVTLASAGRIPRGRRLGVVTPSGGYAIVTLDAAERFGLDVPAATVPPTEAQIAALGPAHFVNPFDVYALFGKGRRSFEAALQWMDAQPVDAIAIWLSYACMAEHVQAIVQDSLTDFVAASDKPVFCCGLTTPEFEAELRDLGVLWFEEPTRLAQALGAVAPRARPADVFETHTSAGHRDVIAGEKARAILSGLKALPQVQIWPVKSAAEAVAVQRDLGGQVFLKLEGDRLAHKTEIGGVVGPLGADTVAAAYAQLSDASAHLPDPAAAIVLQPREEGVELALGAVVDDVFGPSVMVAVGGIFLEVLKDTQFAPAPVTVDQARDMILRLRGAPLLLGARGKPPCDVEAAAAALAELSRFIAAHAADYREIDINPLMVRGKGRGVVAVDALIVATRSQDL
ncbi:MAG: acetate--CoA ligase family protein [Alphaproteobacteria bacterium]|nr:acetate--CoA ligase family protein [Alphaproteobacteria bacterium]MBU1517147.1 acetate--CoA ligase family protein [Alphaproteobacteria bacterium]MBU2096520.1 acetate--CoA ligase family protein [Alphaproteobacteria bacterium]MBU2151672.1 acetate--CoA ligase family protein [Alphaproteobacteria bacterium]MBU2305450.1 acetate--CoA ligase family protein [Alphaproteobacteria bacterium]